MDLKVYYKKIREVIETIPADFAVLVSCETPDGGKPGVMSEAQRALAAKMIVEGRAQLATAEQCADFRRLESESRAKGQRDAAMSRVQVAVLSELDIEALKTVRSGKLPGGK